MLAGVRIVLTCSDGAQRNKFMHLCRKIRTGSFHGITREGRTVKVGRAATAGIIGGVAMTILDDPRRATP